MAEGAEGKVVQVIGTVVDVEFPPDQLPSIYSAIELENAGERLVLEVEQQVGNSWVRCLALGPTEGLTRDAVVTDTGRPITVPVGEASLGRLLNVVGEPLDGLGEIDAMPATIAGSNVLVRAYVDRVEIASGDRVVTSH